MLVSMQPKLSRLNTTKQSEVVNTRDDPEMCRDNYPEQETLGGS